MFLLCLKSLKLLISNLHRAVRLPAVSLPQPNESITVRHWIHFEFRNLIFTGNTNTYFPVYWCSFQISVKTKTWFITQIPFTKNLLKVWTKYDADMKVRLETKLSGGVFPVQYDVKCGVPHLVNFYVNWKYK